MHHTHGEESDSVSISGFIETNINALKERKASGKSIALPCPALPDKWETVDGELLHFSSEKTSDHI